MNLNKAILLTLVVALIGVFFYARSKSGEMRTALESLRRDRDAMERQVNTLNEVLLDQAKLREAVPPPVAEVARIETAATPPASPSPTEVIPVPGVTITPPAGWAKNGSRAGSYIVGVDRNETVGGLPSAYVQSIGSSVDGFGGMMQTTSAEAYVGKRVRLSGWIKTEEANDGGGRLWLRVDGQQAGLQFDNMNNRPVKGTTEWQQYSVVLDVPTEASALAYGFFVSGGGKMWVNGTSIEEVGPEVPSTNMIARRPTRSLPATPVNLAFDPDQPVSRE